MVVGGRNESAPDTTNRYLWLFIAHTQTDRRTDGQTDMHKTLGSSITSGRMATGGGNCYV